MNEAATRAARAADFREMIQPFFDEAAAAGFPVFLTPVALSTPINATPYAIAYRDFLSRASGWNGRAHLARALESVRKMVDDCGATVQVMLVGGSFTELAKASPGDIDCLMLYRRDDAGGAIDAQKLAELQEDGKRQGVDVRFIPLDGDPLVLVKALVYFTVLYSKDKAARGRTDVRLVRGLLLLDCGS